MDKEKKTKDLTVKIGKKKKGKELPEPPQIMNPQSREEIRRKRRPNRKPK